MNQCPDHKVQLDHKGFLEQQQILEHQVQQVQPVLLDLLVQQGHKVFLE
jgi:hypothetical protein